VLAAGVSSFLTSRYAASGVDVDRRRREIADFRAKALKYDLRACSARRARSAGVRRLSGSTATSNLDMNAADAGRTFVLPWACWACAAARARRLRSDGVRLSAMGSSSLAPQRRRGCPGELGRSLDGGSLIGQADVSTTLCRVRLPGHVRRLGSLRRSVRDRVPCSSCWVSWWWTDGGRRLHDRPGAAARIWRVRLDEDPVVERAPSRQIGRAPDFHPPSVRTRRAMSRNPNIAPSARVPNAWAPRHAPRR
jgi:hypothetical protein